MRRLVVVLVALLGHLSLTAESNDVQSLAERLRPLLAPDYVVCVRKVEGGKEGVNVRATDAHRKRVAVTYSVDIVFSPLVSDAEWTANYLALEGARKKVVESKFSKEAVDEYNRAQQLGLPLGTFGSSCVSVIGGFEPAHSEGTEEIAVREVQGVHDKILSVIRLFRVPDDSTGQVHH